MAYQQATIAIASAQAEALSDALMEYGALSVAIEDAWAGTDKEQAIFGEPGEPSAQIWQQSLILALFDEESNVEQMVQTASSSIKINTPVFKLEELPEQDWVRLTQSQFEPIQISERLWITPTWHEAPAKNAINLQLDPGLAFGTGSHPTTHLCLSWLDNNLKGNERVLDYGCGSGILAITAMKLGAKEAIGVDIDKQAIRSSTDNAEQNQVTAQFFLPEQFKEQELFDVVVANILANPLRVLGEMLASHCKVGGNIVLSGILEEQAEEMVAIYQQWFNMNEPIFKDGWTCLSGTKR